jgi:hypothetical protein
MRKYLLCATILVSLFASCKKDRDMKKATVIDTGDVAKGGCGYILKLEEDGQELRPIYLDSRYQHDGTKVKVKYDTNGESQVCEVYPKFRTLIVVDITEITLNQD